ncbi:sugar MFS transporter [Lysobacter tyrosinilyticus]
MLDNVRNTWVSIAIIGVLFFVMGWFTWINGPLIQFVRLAFDLSTFAAFLVTFVFYISYFCWALPASVILDRTGMKKGMAIALWVMAAGAIAFGQFCVQRWYPGALAGLFIIGAGLAILQTAANPYISILGPIESGAQRIAVMGICNKIAGMAAPFLLGTLVLHGMGDIAAKVAGADAGTKEQILDSFASGIHGPYLLMAGVLAVLGLGILFSPLPDVRGEAEATKAQGGGGKLSDHPHVWLGAFAIFMYVGAEVMAGDAVGVYGREAGIPLDQTKFFTMYTLGAMLLGYVVGFILVPRFVTQQRYLAFSSVLGILLTLCAYVASGYASVVFIFALGFANAMMWPAIFPLSIHGLGRLIERGSALLIMGIAGGALVPQLFALLLDRAPGQFQLWFFVLMLPCYLYILYFALYGHRVRPRIGGGASEASASRAGA